MVIAKKIFRQCGTSLHNEISGYFVILFHYFSSFCGYNFDRTVTRNLQVHLESVWLKKVMRPIIKICLVK